MTAVQPRQPNLLIVGAQRSGTTWLHHNLASHPCVFMSQHKELNFFNSSEYREEGAWEKYLTNFDESDGEHIIVGESSPAYFRTRDDVHLVPKRVRERLGPGTRIIASLRNPVSRAASAYFHHVSHGRIEPDQSILDTDDSLAIVETGHYKRHVAAWLEIFPDMKIMIYEDLKVEPQGFLIDALTYLGLGVDFDAPRLEKQINTRAKLKERFADDGADERTIPADDLAVLQRRYEADIQFIESMAGRGLEEWRDLDRVIEEDSTW